MTELVTRTKGTEMRDPQMHAYALECLRLAEARHDVGASASMVIETAAAFLAFIEGREGDGE